MEAFKELLGITSNTEAIYWIIAIVSTSLFLLKMLISFIGSHLDFDLHHDVDFDFAADYLSIDTIIFFFKALGWIGVIGYRFTRFAGPIIFLIALSSGIFAFFLSAFMLRNMRRLESSGNLQMSNAIGQIGTVYLTIPEKGKGAGQIQVTVQGRLATLDAMSEDEKIPTGSKVLVYDVKNDVLVVSIFKEKL